MHRRSIRRSTALVSFAVALGTLISAPMLSSANLVDDVVKNVSDTVKNVTGGNSGNSGNSNSSGSPTPQAGSPPTYTPPLHGTNPHGEGTAARTEIAPNNTLPQPYLPGGNASEIVVGNARGEQNNGAYHGHITVATLLGAELLPGVLTVDTNPGETKHGPLNPVQTMLLNQVCTGSGGQICLTVLTMDSSTTSNSSTNHFSVATAHVGPPGGGINANAVQSDGNISDDGNCQTSHGESHAANASVDPLITATAINQFSDAQACNGGAQSASSSGNTTGVIGLNGMGLPIPVAGCANGTPNSNFAPLNPLLSAVCNADDTNGSQAGAPYTVREGLTVFTINVLDMNSPLLKVTAGGPEALARAPGSGPPNPSCANTPSLCPDNGGGGNNNNNGNNGGPGGFEGQCDNDDGDAPARCAAASAANAGKGNLAFTGANVLLMAMLGLGLVGAGLATKAGLEARREGQSA